MHTRFDFANFKIFLIAFKSLARRIRSFAVELPNIQGHRFLDIKSS